MNQEVKEVELKTNNKVVYLIGAMEYSPDFGKAWRDKATELLAKDSIDTFHPNRDETAILKLLDMSSTKELADLKCKDLDSYRKKIQAIIKYDLDHLWNSDVALIKLDKGAIGGASGEATIAWRDGLPTIGWLDPKEDIKPIPGWLLGCCDEIYPTLEEAIQAVVRIINSGT